MTPLAPRAPQMALEAASFSTLISLMSSGFTERRVANCSSLSRSSKFTFDTSSGRSKMLPSTTMSGSALPLMVLTPRIRILVPAPRLPEFEMMSRPAILPCSASSADAKLKPSTSSMFIVWVATEISFTGMVRPLLCVLGFALITTSSIMLASCKWILNFVWLPICTL